MTMMTTMMTTTRTTRTTTTTTTTTTTMIMTAMMMVKSNDNDSNNHTPMSHIRKPLCLLPSPNEEIVCQPHKRKCQLHPYCSLHLPQKSRHSHIFRSILSCYDYKTSRQRRTERPRRARRECQRASPWPTQRRDAPVPAPRYLEIAERSDAFDHRLLEFQRTGGPICSLPEWIGQKRPCLPNV